MLRPAEKAKQTPCQPHTQTRTKRMDFKGIGMHVALYVNQSVFKGVRVSV